MNTETSAQFLIACEELSDSSHKVINLDMNLSMYDKELNEEFFVYDCESKRDLCEQMTVYNSFENNSSKFYQEHSQCDIADIKERTQKWIEEKFKDDESEGARLFIDDEKLDNLMENVAIISVNKTKGEGPCKFSREDLIENIDTKSGENFSVFTDKGSEGGIAQENAKGDIGDMKVSNFWKRVDMRQKKVIRGLCGLAKDYFKTVISSQKSQDGMFKTWDDTLKSFFPELYGESRLQLLGHISVMCLSWKFPEKIMSCSLFSQAEKEAIIKHGSEFRDQRNKCSSSKVRKSMMSSPIVMIGKRLY
jgi:hypothetical protein